MTKKQIHENVKNHAQIRQTECFKPNSLIIQFEIKLHLHITMTSCFMKMDDNNRY